MKVFHEDVFDDFFIPYKHPDSKIDIWGGIGLETYGYDLNLAMSLNENFLWTVLEDQRQFIVPGYHRVNRICYIATEIAHNFAEIYFNVTDKSIGEKNYKSQINWLRKYYIKSI